MVKHLATLLAVGLLSACGPTANSGGSKSPLALSEIQGDWDIVEFDGYQPDSFDSDGERHAFVKINPTSLSYTIECNYAGMNAVLGENGILQSTESENDWAQTEMWCGEIRQARDQSFFRFMQSRPKATLLKNGNLILATGDQSLLLEPREVARLRNAPNGLRDLLGLWTIVSFQDPEGTKWGGVNFVGAGGPNYQGRIEISDTALIYLRECQRILIEATIDEVGQLSKRQNTMLSVEPGNCEPLNSLETQLINFLTAGPFAERIDSRRIRFVQNGRSLVLSKSNIMGAESAL